VTRDPLDPKANQEEWVLGVHVVTLVTLEHLALAVSQVLGVLLEHLVLRVPLGHLVYLDPQGRVGQLGLQGPQVKWDNLDLVDSLGPGVTLVHRVVLVLLDLTVSPGRLVNLVHPERLERKVPQVLLVVLALWDPLAILVLLVTLVLRASVVLTDPLGLLVRRDR